MSVQRLDVSAFAEVQLVDHHCHGVIEHVPDRREFESMITESNWDAPVGTTVFDSQLGVAIRRHCAPLLGLEPHASAEAYLARRAELAPAEVNDLLLKASGIDRYLIETGHRGDTILSPQGMADRSGASADQVIRLERLAEQIAETQPAPAAFADRFRELLREQLRTAVGVKSIAAYRIGLDFDPERPSDREVELAAAAWFTEIESGSPIRLADAVLIRFGIWTAVDERCAIQFHIGFGDDDVDLHRCDPLLLTEWLRMTRTSGARVTLLHCYPFHRNAGFLAHVFPHVYCDVGLAINYVGARSPQIIAESLELTPMNKALFSSDAWGLPELYFLGSHLFKKGLLQVVNGWIDADEWSVADGEKLIRRICNDNAVRAYELAETPRFLAPGVSA